MTRKIKNNSIFNSLNNDGSGPLKSNNLKLVHHKIDFRESSLIRENDVVRMKVSSW